MPLALARDAGELRAGRALDLRGLALVTRRRARDRVGARARQPRGLGERRGARPRSPAGALLLAAFVALGAARAARRCCRWRFFRSRAFSAGNAAIFFAFGSLFCGVFFLAQFMQTGARLRPARRRACGCCRGRRRCSSSRPIAGALVDRFGERPFLVAGPLLQAGGMGWIALVAEAGMAYGELVPPLIVAGVGVSMSFPAAQNSVVGSVPAEAIGKAAGINSTMRELGGVFGIAISVAVFAGAGSYASAAAFSDGFAAAMGVSAGLSLLAALAGAALPGRSRAALPGRPALEGEAG